MNRSPPSSVHPEARGRAGSCERMAVGRPPARKRRPRQAFVHSETTVTSARRHLSNGGEETGLKNQPACHRGPNQAEVGREARPEAGHHPRGSSAGQETAKAKAVKANAFREDKLPVRKGLHAGLPHCAFKQTHRRTVVWLERAGDAGPSVSSLEAPRAGPVDLCDGVGHAMSREDPHPLVLKSLLPAT